MKGESLYQYLPIPLQNLACSLEGLRIQRSRFGSGFKHLLADAEARASWSDEQIKTYRDQRLHEFVKYCAINIPFTKLGFAKQAFILTISEL